MGYYLKSTAIIPWKNMNLMQIFPPIPYIYFYNLQLHTRTILFFITAAVNYNARDPSLCPNNS